MMQGMSPFKYFLPAVAWWLLSFYLFTLPGSAFPTTDWWDELPIDKLVHVFLFAVLVALFYMPWLKGKVPSSSNTFWLYLIPLMAIGYGIGIEFIQLHFVANRGFEISDMLADAAGAVLAFWWGRRQWKRKLS